MEIDAHKTLNTYIATFHTHFSALRTCKALKASGVSAGMTPVPRALSASCGTCVRYNEKEPRADCLHEDFDRVFRLDETGGYREVLKNHEDL